MPRGLKRAAIPPDTRFNRPLRCDSLRRGNSLSRLGAHDSGVRIGSETGLPVKRCGGLFWQRHGDTRDLARTAERSGASK